MQTIIKQRIEQIKNGEIPEGYKRTKAGIIPEKWEIKKLSDVLKKQTQKNTNNEIQNVLTNSATQGIVCQTEYFDKQIANNENTSGYYIVKPGYFVYNPRISVSAPCGPFNRYNGDKDGIMSPLYSVYCFCDKSITYANFLTYYFSSSKWYAYMNSIANYGVRSDRMNVTGEDMNNMPIPYPPLPEQPKIVAILSAQDKVIECYEKKIEQLKRMKKYYLQNMFPKRGETVPKIRFKGFTDPWEQRKLGEFGCSEGGTSIESEFSNAGKYKVISIGSYSEESNYLDQGIRAKESDKTNRRVLKQNDLTMILNDKTASGNIIGRVLFIDKSDVFVYNQRTEMIRPNTDEFHPKFLYHLLNAPTQREKIIKQSQGNTQIYVNWSKISETTYMIPEIAEQKVISRYCDCIDNLITLHQRKLEEENKKKKALQQLLLTGIVRTN